MYNRVLTLSEHLRSTVKLVIYPGRGCLLFRMACTALVAGRTHTAQKAAAASHIEPCPAQHIQRFQSPTLLQYTFKTLLLSNFVSELQYCWDHRPAQTNQSPKRDNGLSKGQNVCPSGKKKEEGPNLETLRIWLGTVGRDENECGLRIVSVCEGAAWLCSLCWDLYACDSTPAAANCLLQDQTKRRWVRTWG